MGRPSAQKIWSFSASSTTSTPVYNNVITSSDGSRIIAQYEQYLDFYWDLSSNNVKKQQLVTLTTITGTSGLLPSSAGSTCIACDISADNIYVLATDSNYSPPVHSVYQIAVTWGASTLSFVPTLRWSDEKYVGGSTPNLRYTPAGIACNQTNTTPTLFVTLLSENLYGYMLFDPNPQVDPALISENFYATQIAASSAYSAYMIINDDVSGGIYWFTDVTNNTLITSSEPLIHSNSNIACDAGNDSAPSGWIYVSGGSTSATSLDSLYRMQGGLDTIIGLIAESDGTLNDFTNISTDSASGFVLAGTKGTVDTSSSIYYFTNFGAAFTTKISGLPDAVFTQQIQAIISKDSSQQFAIVSDGAFSAIYRETEVQPLPPVVCFKEGTKILCMVSGAEEHVPIENLRRGSLVKTSLDGYKAIDMIGQSTIIHEAVSDRIKDQLYVCSKEKYPTLFEDLVITGSHSILVKQFKDEEQKKMTQKVNGKIYITDKHYRLPACVDDRASVYPEKGTYNIFHIALDHSNYFMNYGIYANGLLVETCSKRYLKELANMDLIE